jgi:hypothetical protein
MQQNAIVFARTLRRGLLTVSFLLLVVLMFGCSGGGDSGGGDAASEEFPSQCGVVFNGQARTAPPDDQVYLVSIEAVTPELLRVTYEAGELEGEQILVKLQSVSSASVSTGARTQGIDLINAIYSSAYFVPAGTDCTTPVVGGAPAVVGQVFSLNGENLTEALIASGAVKPISGDVCGGDALTGCYASIPVIEEPSAFVIDDFLWKPAAERDGNLVVLVNPFAARVVVNGTTLTDFGPSNGRGTTARANKPGCAFGNNVTVEVFDFQDRRIFTADGKPSVTVPRGCDRYEFTL